MDHSLYLCMVHYHTFCMMTILLHMFHSPNVFLLDILCIRNMEAVLNKSAVDKIFVLVNIALLTFSEKLGLLHLKNLLDNLHMGRNASCLCRYS